MYIIPKKLATKICYAWRTETILLGIHKQILGPSFDHADQIGFAMAMLSCGFDTEEIPIEFNFPMHLSDRLERLSFEEPKVLHYHWLQNADGLLKATGNPIVDNAVAQVNELLQQSSGKLFANANTIDHVTTVGQEHSTSQTQVFTYWDGSDLSIISNMISEWTKEFREFKVFGISDAISLLQQYFPDYVDMYSSIRIPAAKSDIARLLLLYEHGGLYVDCHCGICDAPEIRCLIAELKTTKELIFIDRRIAQKPRPTYEHFLLNSIIFSKARSHLIFATCQQGLANLAWQRKREAAEGFVPYHIASLSGPRLITAMVLQPGSFNRDVRRDYQDRVEIIPEESAPIERNRHRTYDGSSQHWSERQRNELLFDRKA